LGHGRVEGVGGVSCVGPFKELESVDAVSTASSTALGRPDVTRHQIADKQGGERRAEYDPRRTAPPGQRGQG
jgi:hypothetical protein